MESVPPLLVRDAALQRHSSTVRWWCNGAEASRCEVYFNGFSITHNPYISYISIWFFKKIKNSNWFTTTTVIWWSAHLHRLLLLENFGLRWRFQRSRQNSASQSFSIKWLPLLFVDKIQTCKGYILTALSFSKNQSILKPGLHAA